MEAAASAALYDLLLTDKKPSGKADLADLRRKIDRADRAILDSFLLRMQTSAEIAAYKSEKKLPVRDEAREDALLKKIAGETSPREWRPYSTALFTTILALSRTEQERITETAETG